MNASLIRLWKRRTSWTLSVGEIKSIEFTDDKGNPDLKPSLYEIDAGLDEHIQACAEHYAAIPLDVERSVRCVQVDSATHKIRTTPGKEQFKFIRDRHREVVLNDDAELVRFVEHVNQQKLAGATFEVSKADILSYAKMRMEMKDPEWERVSASPTSEGKKWIRNLSQTSQ